MTILDDRPAVGVDAGSRSDARPDVGADLATRLKDAVTRLERFAADPETLPSDWHRFATCADTPKPDTFFPNCGKTAERAKAICARCPVLYECLADAVLHNDTYGVRGGMSRDQRRALRTRLLALGQRPKPRPLNERERRVLSLTRAGESATTIACELNIADRTVVRIRARLVKRGELAA